MTLISMGILSLAVSALLNVDTSTCFSVKWEPIVAVTPDFPLVLVPFKSLIVGTVACIRRNCNLICTPENGVYYIPDYDAASPPSPFSLSMKCFTNNNGMWAETQIRAP